MGHPWAAVRDSECLREARCAAGQQDVHEGRVELVDEQLEWLLFELWVARAEIEGWPGANGVARGPLVLAKPEIVSSSTWEMGSARGLHGPTEVGGKQR